MLDNVPLIPSTLTVNANPKVESRMNISSGK